MNYLDIILLAIVALNVITGFASGFTRVGIGFIAAVLGVLFGFWFYYIPAEWIRSMFGWERGASIAGFCLVYMAFAIAGALVGKILGKMLKVVGLSFFDRVGGAAFGFVRGAVFVIAVATVITAFSPQPPPRVIAESQVMPYAAAGGNVLAWLAPKSLKEAYYESLEKLQRFWKEHGGQKTLDRVKGSTV